ncbi:MAG: aldehyde dehydrogenase family protein [Nitrososphaerota archaeon]
MISSKFWNSGQSCIAAERLYIHKDIYRKSMEKFVSNTKSLKIGDTRISDIGPLINKGALQATELVVKNALRNVRSA